MPFFRDLDEKQIPGRPKTELEEFGVLWKNLELGGQGERSHSETGLSRESTMVIRESTALSLWLVTERV